MQRFFRSSIQGPVGLASQLNSCEQPFITYLKHLLRHQSTCMHMDISPSLHNFVCTNTIKLETDFIGTLIYTLWLMSKDTCTFILKLFWYHQNRTHQKTVTSAKWANHFYNTIYGKNEATRCTISEWILVSETKSNHISLFKSCKQCCI